MLVVLAILALGAVISWAMVDILSTSFEHFAPLGTALHAHPLGDFVSHTFTSMAIVLSLVALGVGFILYWFRNSLKDNKVSQWIIKYARKGFGFDKLYEDVLVGFKKISVRLRRLQTGDANMNFVGIVIVVIALFIMLLWQGVV